MIDSEKLQAMLAELKGSFDEKDYPETAEILTYEWDADDLLILNRDLFDADNTRPMPPAVAALVEAIYEDIIRDGGEDVGEAACNLGSLYYTGRIGVQSYAKAVELYTIAAEHGDRAAAENLGYCYYYGRDVEKDYEKAFHFFALGAFDGHLISLYKIGDMYRYGLYVKKNSKEAYYIYKHCYETLTREAERICGADVVMRYADCHAEGIGTEKDLPQAMALYQRAEQLFYKRLTEGDFLIRRSYEKCIARQGELRAELQRALPDYGWTGYHE